MGKREEKDKRKKRQEKQNNKFEMYGPPQTYYRGVVKVSFEPERDIYCQNEEHDEVQLTNTASSTDIRSNKSNANLSIIPIFNNDCKFYTACFINPYQSDDSDEQQKNHHSKKIEESKYEIDLPQIFVPKPRSKSQYCAVCRFIYEDYLEHIETSLHHRNIHRSMFNAEMKNLAKILEKKNNNYEGVVTRATRKKMDKQTKIIMGENGLNLLRYKRQRKMQNGDSREGIQEPERETRKQQPLQTQAKSLNWQLN